MNNLGDNHLSQARASLQQALSWYSSFRRHWNYPPDAKLQAAVREDLQVLKSSLDKLEQTVIKIATFGLVSRGKSSVVNALLGEKILSTGPLHGVTQWPKSVRWTPPSGKVQVELIDTPGLDEIEGEARAEMAKAVAKEADLILFVVAGDITRTESIPVKVQWPDGRITQEWENPSPEIRELREKILEILNREGRSLLALNALVQARDAEINIARKTLEIRQEDAEKIIWNYAKYKSLAIAINPIPLFDVLGGGLTDLFLIRSLSRLYGLPITNYQAGKILKTIITSTGGLLLGEIITSTILGMSKISLWENPTDFSIYTGTALTQAAIAGYGSYIVGKSTQIYLEKGCTWGPLGPSTVIEEILTQIESDTIIARLEKEYEIL